MADYNLNGLNPRDFQEEYRPKLDLNGCACWDYNDLRGFLDGDQDIRTAYGHFITAGDVLYHR